MKGVDESFESQEEFHGEPIITKDIVTFTKVELDHLMCNSDGLA